MEQLSADSKHMWVVDGKERVYLEWPYRKNCARHKVNLHLNAHPTTSITEKSVHYAVYIYIYIYISVVDCGGSRGHVSPSPSFIPLK